MARTEWLIYKMIHDAVPDWKPDGAIYRPNDIFVRTKVSNQSKTQRADGQNTYTIPTTKYIDENITFTWYYDDGTMKDKIETYIEDHQEVKIVDHNSVEYIGRFISISPMWLVGEDENRYDIQAGFEIMPLITAASSSSSSSSSSSYSSSSSSSSSKSSSSSSSSSSSVGA